MEDQQFREKFDTGIKKIREEIKSRLIAHGLFGRVNAIDEPRVIDQDQSSRIEIVVKAHTVGRSFDHAQIEGCCLRVGGAVLIGIISMIDEVAA
jgi:hypothetical protein